MEKSSGCSSKPWGCSWENFPPTESGSCAVMSRRLEDIRSCAGKGGERDDDDSDDVWEEEGI